MNRPAALALMLLLAGCDHALLGPTDTGPKIIMPPAAATAGCPHIPPPRAAGKPPKPPASDFPQVLQPGAWSWGGLDYVWTPPRWVILVGTKHPQWQAGRWRSDHGACVWMPAHWVEPPVRIPGS